MTKMQASYADSQVTTRWRCNTGASRLRYYAAQLARRYRRFERSWAFIVTVKQPKICFISKRLYLVTQRQTVTSHKTSTFRQPYLSSILDSTQHVYVTCTFTVWLTSGTVILACLCIGNHSRVSTLPKSASAAQQTHTHRQKEILRKLKPSLA